MTRNYEERTLAFDLLSKGFPITEIANKIGVHRTTVHRWAKQLKNNFIERNMNGSSPQQPNRNQFYLKHNFGKIRKNKGVFQYEKFNFKITGLNPSPLGEPL